VQQQQQPQSQGQFDMWQQWAATTAPAKRSSGGLMDDNDDDEDMDHSVMQHMQLPGANNNGIPEDSPFFSMPLTRLASAQSGALPMVALRRCNHS